MKVLYRKVKISEKESARKESDISFDDEEFDELFLEGLNEMETTYPISSFDATDGFESMKNVCFLSESRMEVKDGSIYVGETPVPIVDDLSLEERSMIIDEFLREIQKQGVDLSSNEASVLSMRQSELSILEEASENYGRRSKEGYKFVREFCTREVLEIPKESNIVYLNDLPGKQCHGDYVIK